MTKNILLTLIEKLKLSIKESLEKIISEKNLDFHNLPEIVIEVPAEKTNGNLSSNVAMVSAKILKMSPYKIAELIVVGLPQNEYIAETKVAGPGFINFFLNDKFFVDSLKEIKNLGKNYGKSNFGNNKKVMVEFVSANPTGPMHMGNARIGAMGDCLSSLLSIAGYNVTKEFYVNDAGNQIEKFGMSLDIRYRQICEGENSVQLPEDAYHGEDIILRAKEFFEIHGDKFMGKSETERQKALIDFALPKNIEKMKSDLAKYGIFYDNWFFESDLYKNKSVEKTIENLKSKNLTYEKDGCLWYKATDFGVDKDVVLIRKNGNPTYFAADIAYHHNKFFVRNFDLCINILGADHHGHMGRMHSITEALGIEKNRLKILLVQLVRLMRGGEVVRMSKRTGKSIQLVDLLDEVGRDAARFIFNTREANSGMDFDLDLAIKEDSQNPVYYVQYAHARICGIFKNLGKTDFENADLELLKMSEEKDLIFILASYVSETVLAAKTLDPTKITRFATEVATLFHKFYTKCKVNHKDENLKKARLYLCYCAKTVLKNILDLLGINAPEFMGNDN